MPCRYDESAEEIEARKKASKKRIIQPYKKELDKVTRLLCSVMTQIDMCREDENCRTSEEVLRKVINVSDLLKWWGNHKERDAIREKTEAREVVKKKALEKLTLEEKRILGLTK